MEEIKVGEYVRTIFGKILKSDDKFIKSIVTHEQFAQIEYKVEE